LVCKALQKEAYDTDSTGATSGVPSTSSNRGGGVMSTKAVTLKDAPYPRVHQKQTQIEELERRLKFIIQKGENLIIQKEGLHRLPPDTASTQKQWAAFKVQVVSNKSERDDTTEKLTLFKKDLPQLLDQAEKAEADLVGKKEELKGIKVQIIKIDKELTRLLQRPMALIKERQETILNLQKADEKISSLTSLLRWHPSKRELAPLSPEVLDELQKLLPRPQVIRFKG